eukprot:2398520-Pyramimonas_sp.AAC.1
MQEELDEKQRPFEAMQASLAARREALEAKRLEVEALNDEFKRSAEAMAPPRSAECPGNAGVKLEFEEEQLEPEVREFIKSDTWAKLRGHSQK